jgi:hypothetical protein
MDHRGWLLDSSGQVWNVTTPELGVWTRWPGYDVPVPVAQIEHWGAHSLLTTDGTVWAHDDALDTWINCGPVPGGPISVESKSWGASKEAYRPK